MSDKRENDGHEIDADPMDAVLVSAVTLAAGIASNHSALAGDELEKLRRQGMHESHLARIVEIARRVRDEVAAKFDAAFDDKAK